MNISVKKRVDMITAMFAVIADIHESEAKTFVESTHVYQDIIDEIECVLYDSYSANLLEIAKELSNKNSWLTKMKQQRSKNDFWSVATTYIKNNELSVLSFIPSFILKPSLRFLMSRHLTYNDMAKELITEPYMPNDLASTKFEPEKLKHTKHMLIQRIDELIAACDSENELIKLSSLDTEVLLLSDCSDSKHVKASIEKIAALNPKFHKVSVNMGRSPIMPVTSKSEFMKTLKCFLP